MDLQARVKGEFRALHQILQDEETWLLEQLRREQEEELEKVQRHLEALELAERELDNNIQMLQQAKVTLTEVKSFIYYYYFLNLCCPFLLSASCDKVYARV